VTDHANYFEYLRSRLGLLYRRLMEADCLLFPNGSFDGVVGASGFSCGDVFHTLMKSRWLASWPPQYCLYGIFERS